MTTEIIIPISRLPHYPAGSPLPDYMTLHAAGIDLRAAITETVTLKPLERALVPTGIALAIPPGYEGQVRPRSGLALKKGLTLLNSPGTIDSDYRGEIQLILVNLGDKSCLIESGERIGQIIFSPVARAQWREVDDVSLESASIRGTQGFGHTGEK